MFLDTQDREEVEDFLLSQLREDGAFNDGEEPFGWLAYSVNGDLLTVSYEIDDPREVISETWKLVRVD